MTELQILSAVKNNGDRISFTKLLSLNCCDPEPYASHDKALIKSLISAGYLRGGVRAYATISMTDEGRKYLAQLISEEDLATQAKEELSKQKAQEEEQQRFENKLAILNALIPIGTFLLGALFGYLADLLRLFLK